MSEVKAHILDMADKLEAAATRLRNISNSKYTPAHKANEALSVVHYLLPNIGATALLDCTLIDTERKQCS